MNCSYSPSSRPREPADPRREINLDREPEIESVPQRVGQTGWRKAQAFRTGRRPGASQNCLFLATSDDSLVRAAALIDLWNDGFVEPSIPPLLPYHILAQQMMAITLQESGIGRDELCQRIAGVSAFRDMGPERREAILQWMLDREILCSDQGIIGFGRRGEESFGRKHFLELFSVFLSPPLFTILHGRQELGFVDELSFLGKKEGPRILLLGGRAWLVNHIDWQRRRAYVEATTASGRSRWKGWTRGLDYELCQSIKRLLTGEETSDHWSRRANEQIKEIRREFAWLEGDSTAVTVGRSGDVEWWTFGGTRANATLATALAKATGSRVDYDALNLAFESRITSRDIESALKEVRSVGVNLVCPAVDEDAIGVLKFSNCLPEHFAVEMLEHRLSDEESTIKILDHEVRYESGIVESD